MATNALPTRVAKPAVKPTSFTEELIASVFEPGVRPATLQVLNYAIGALILSIGLLWVSGVESMHVFIFLFLACGLFASLNWYVHVRSSNLAPLCVGSYLPSTCRFMYELGQSTAAGASSASANAPSTSSPSDATTPSLSNAPSVPAGAGAERAPTSGKQRDASAVTKRSKKT